MENFQYFYDGLLLAQPFDFRRKKQALQLKVNHMLNRLSSMFKWEGLPDTIPQRMLELYLMSSGACAVTKVGEELYAFTGGLGGEPDEYYRPTIFTVANPYLKFNEMLRIDEECALVLNDTCHAGLLGLLEQYGTAMVENELSMQVATINSRVMSIITAEDDNAKASADKFLEDIESGKLSAIGAQKFFEGVQTQPYAVRGATALTDLIEYEQYLKASLFNELGLNANYNMKRESLNSAESQLNNDALTPLIDDMLNCRKHGADKINELYGTEITVEFSGAWKDNELESAAELAAIVGESETVDEVAEDPETPEESEVTEDDKSET